MRLSCERLEDRTVPSVTAGIMGGVLTIVGDGDRQDLLVSLEGTNLVVTNEGALVGQFVAAGVTSLDITLLGGSDQAAIAPAITLPAAFDGGDGDDVLLAGSGPTTLVGGVGDDRLTGGIHTDLLIGGVGNDRLYGGDSADQLDGGFGKDQLFGEAGNDNLIGGDSKDFIRGGDGDDAILGDGGKDDLFGDAGNDVLNGAADNDILFAGTGNDILDGGAGVNRLVPGGGTDFDAGSGQALQVAAQALAAQIEASVFAQLGTGGTEVLAASEVEALLQRAAAASASDDAIIAVVDRNGRILGVRVEAGVSPTITGDVDNLVFAIDGAVAKARTGAFFGNNGAPLNSRTIQFISQTTVTEREVNSYPSIIDPNSVLRGPGFVAPIGIGGHFPPNVMFTTQVDLFAIEHTNRDSLLHPGNDRIKGTADDTFLPARFNIDPMFLAPGKTLFAPESYGFVSGLRPQAQARGIATLPGGIPLYKNGSIVGGIGVFFPGQTGFASEENSALSSNFDPTRPDRSFEAEFIAFAAAGGVHAPGLLFNGALNGAPALPNFVLPVGRIDLVGITLDLFGPSGTGGTQRLVDFGSTLGAGNPNSGANQIVNGMGATSLDGMLASEGWIVTPHDGVGLSAHDVVQIIAAGIQEAMEVRAAIRLPLDARTRMVFSVTDLEGNVLGLFRMPDATIFSIDVAVAKARNVSYYADPAALQAVDQLAGVPAGAAFTNRTFRYAALPRFPEGIDGFPPGPFSILNDGGVDSNTGLQIGAPLPASAFQSVLGFDAFNPGTNFRDPGNILNQNGIVFFPGSGAVYKDTNGDGVIELVGGFGVSGDGVDQDDVVTFAGLRGYEPPALFRADQFFVNDVRLPYQKFNRNPKG